jgi:hypothetical protein
MLSNPRRQLLLIGVPGVPLISQDDDPIVLAVSNDSPDRLIDSPHRFLLIPLFPCESMILIGSNATVILHLIGFSLYFLVQIVLFH